MENTIDRKNRLLKNAGNALGEIWEISTLIDHVTCDRDSCYKSLLNLVQERLSTLSYKYDDYITESQIYEEPDRFLDLPEEEELFAVPDENQPTEEEITEVREVTGDD